MIITEAEYNEPATNDKLYTIPLQKKGAIQTATDNKKTDSVKVEEPQTNAEDRGWLDELLSPTSAPLEEASWLDELLSPTPASVEDTQELAKVARASTSSNNQSITSSSETVTADEE